MTKYLILIVFVLLMGCASYRPLTVGMAANDIVKERGQPEYRKKVLDYEIWLYQITEPDFTRDGQNDVCLIKDDKVVVSRVTTGTLQRFDGWASHTSEVDLRKDLDCIVKGKVRNGMSQAPVLLSLGEPIAVGAPHSVGYLFIYADKQIVFDETNKVSDVSNE